MPIFRYPIGRDVLCPEFDHLKSVQVCKKQPYDACRGCSVRREDRERFGGRPFYIVESTHNPGPHHVPELLSSTDGGETWERVDLSPPKPTVLKPKKRKKKRKDKDAKRKKRKHRREG